MGRMLRIWICLLCMPVLFCVSTQAEEHCMLVPLSLEHRVQAATLIVEGAVKNSKSYWDAEHKMIYTVHEVQLTKLFKGQVPGKELTIVTEGGTVDNEAIYHTATLQLRPGVTGIFLCTPSPVRIGPGNQPQFTVYSSLQGFVRYDPVMRTATDPFAIFQDADMIRNRIVALTGVPFAVLGPDPFGADRAPASGMKTTATPVITSFSPASTPGGIETQLTINGSNFGATQGTGYVEFPNANDGGLSYVRPLAADYVSWTNNSIVVRVPSNAVIPAGCAGTGNFRVTNSDPATGTSPSPLTIPWTYTNFESGGVPYRADLINDNGAGGYTFQYASSFASNTAAVGAFERALDSWCVTQVNWTSGTTTSTNVIASDGINLVRFDTGPQLPAGVLGRLTSYYSGCGPAGGPYNWYVNEMDIAFDDGANWQYGPALPSFSQYDFESVAVHELGHGHQLNHVINTTDVMHYAIANSQVRRTPSTDDVNGGTYVVTNSLVANSCGPTPMIPSPCPLPVTLLSFTGKRVEGEGIVLSWEVADEDDIDGYEVTRSRDGQSYDIIGFVKATNGSVNEYQFTDTDPQGESFYRLNIKEMDGSVSYSRIVRIRPVDQAGTVSVYPNPMGSTITITADGDLLDGGELTMVAADGRVVRRLVFSPLSGMQDISLPVADLPAGMYFYRIRSREGKSFTGRLFKP